MYCFLKTYGVIGDRLLNKVWCTVHKKIVEYNIWCSICWHILELVESLQSHFILTMSHWSSGLTLCFLSQGTWVQIPWGLLMWNWDSPVSVVSLHCWPRRDWSFLWPPLRWASSRIITRPSCRQCDNPTWSHTAFLSQFHARCRSSFQLHNLRSRLRGGALWTACNLTSFSPCLTGPMDLPFASCHKGPGFKSPRGYLCETGIFLLALSRYKLILSFTVNGTIVSSLFGVLFTVRIV